MIPKTMRALMVENKETYEFRTDVPVPEIAEDELLLKVEAVGICAGDTKTWHGAAKFWGDENQPSWVKSPFIPGHEVIGHVVKRGANFHDKNIELNDRVAVEQIAPCGECKFCKTGRYWMCQKHDIYGFQGNVNGGMAEYMKIANTGLVYKVPMDMSIEAAILAEPYACAKHAIDRANISNEDVVVLSGAGPLGMGMIGAAKLRNPKTLIVLDLLDERLEKAKEFGADIVMNPAKEDVVQKIVDLTDGYGCDIYVEATGAPPSVVQGLKAIRKLGTFVEFSVFGAETTVDWSIIGDSKELDLLGSHLSPYCFEQVIEWIGNGKMPTEGVVTHTLPLEEWEEGFKINDKGVGSIKVMLKP